MLFLRAGRLCFDIGWEGCITGHTRVDDDVEHEVGLEYAPEENRYYVLVDGCRDGGGLRAVPDHAETAFTIGRAVGRCLLGNVCDVANGDMAPDFRGEISHVTHTNFSTGICTPLDALPLQSAAVRFSDSPPHSIDLSGSGGAFCLKVIVKTVSPRGCVLSKAFQDGLWRNGGKMLFIRNGLLCFAIGRVGCIEGRTRVDDDVEHEVGLEYDLGANSYHVLVDGHRDGSGLHSVPDHAEAQFTVGRAVGHYLFGNVANGDMAPDFRGDIRGLEMNNGSLPDPEEEWLKRQKAC